MSRDEPNGYTGSVCCMRTMQAHLSDESGIGGSTVAFANGQPFDGTCPGRDSIS